MESGNLSGLDLYFTSPLKVRLIFLSLGGIWNSNSYSSLLERLILSKDKVIGMS